jgi:hypothetical protein
VRDAPLKLWNSDSAGLLSPYSAASFLSGWTSAM